jgi:predicted dehydrogenase
MNPDQTAPLRLAIVGCGAVTERYHLPAVDASPEVELVALVDPDRDRANELATRYQAHHVLPDHDQLPGLVDCAIVATPNSLHAPIASSLAGAGVHVLIEKPLATTTAECDAVAAAAEAGGAVAAVGHDFRHFPVAAYAAELFRSDLLGPIRSVELLQSAGGRWPYATTYVFSRESSGGGVLIDFGVHMLDLLAWWLGDLDVQSYADDVVAGVETECEVQLTTSAGAPVSVALTRLRPMRDTTIVECEGGTVEIGIFEPAVVKLTLPSDRALVGDVPDTGFAQAPLRTVFLRQLADFAAAVRTGSAPLVPLSEGRRVVDLVERCYAARTQLSRPWDWPQAYQELVGPR